jgi:hypothetical protein
MAKKRISQLPVPAAFNGTEIAHVERSGVSRQILFGSAAVANVTTSTTDTTVGRVYRTQDLPREKGTLTPTLRDSQNSAVFTYTEQTAAYQRIDNLLFVHFTITWTDRTFGSSTGIGLRLGLGIFAGLRPVSGIITSCTMTLPTDTITVSMSIQTTLSERMLLNFQLSNGTTTTISGSAWPTSGSLSGSVTLLIS